MPIRGSSYQSERWTPKDVGRHERTRTEEPAPRRRQNGAPSQWQSAPRRPGDDIVLPKGELPTKRARPSTPKPKQELESPTTRLSAKFNEESITKAMWVLFGCTADERTERPETHSPIEGQFKPTAHRFLINYFARKALGDSEGACEKELVAFFDNIEEQRAKKAETGDRHPLDESVLNRATITPLIDEAIEKLVPKGL